LIFKKKSDIKIRFKTHLLTFKKREDEMSQNQKTFETISGREIVLDTTPEACRKFKSVSGQIFQAPDGTEIEIVGVGIAEDGFFKGETVWGRQKGTEMIFYIEPQSGFLPFSLPGEGYLPV